MNIVIKVPVFSFVRKWAIKKYHQETIDLATNEIAIKDIRIYISGRKHDQDFTNDEKKVLLPVRLNDRQSILYKKYKFEHEVMSAFTDRFKMNLFDFYQFSILAYPEKSIMTIIRDFLEQNDLLGEDITLDYCRMTIYRMKKTYEKINKKN